MPLKWSHFFSLGFASITALTERASPFQEAPDVLKYSPGCPFPGEMQQADCLTGTPVSGDIGGGQAVCLSYLEVPWRRQWTYVSYFGWKSKDKILVFRCWMDKVIIPWCLFQHCSKTRAAAFLVCFTWAVCRLQILTGDMAGWQTIAEFCGIHRLENGVTVKKQETHLLQSPARSTAGTGRQDGKML